jgi:hypothetical protein
MVSLGFSFPVIISTQKKQVYMPTTTEYGVITRNPSSKIQVLTSSYQTGERWCATSKDQRLLRLHKASTRCRYEARVEICGAVGRPNIVIWWHNNQNSNADWVNAQRRYCAGPRLDRTRDASLEHQRCHGAAQQALGKSSTARYKWRSLKISGLET